MGIGTGSCVLNSQDRMPGYHWQKEMHFYAASGKKPGADSDPVKLTVA